MFRLLKLHQAFSKAGELSVVIKGLKSGVQPVAVKMPLVKKYGEMQINHPLQGLLGCLATCQIHTAFFHAKKDGVDLKQIDFTKIISNYDPAGWIAGKQTDQILGDIDIDVEVTSSSPQKDVEKLWHKVEKVCPVYKTFVAAGIKINVNLTVKN